MCVRGMRKAEIVLKQELPRCASQQVGSSDDMGNVLSRVVDDDCELISKVAVAATDDEIAGALGEIDFDWTLEQVVKMDRCGWDTHAKGQRTVGIARTATAPAGVEQLVSVRAMLLCCLDFRARTGARVRHSLLDQAGERGLVGLRTITLIQDGTIPFKAKGFERAKNGIGAARNNPRWIKVFNSNQPLAASCTSIQIARDGRH